MPSKPATQAESQSHFSHSLPDPPKIAFYPERLFTGLTAGLISGTLTVIICTAFAALIFSGPLSGYVSRGISFILFGAFIIGSVTAMSSSYAGTIARPHEIPAAILALMASYMGSQTAGSLSVEAAFINVVVAIIITSFCAGAFFLLLGFLKAGNLIRFIPYPVIGGFLAGTGLLLMKGAFSVMTAKPFTIDNFIYFMQFSVLLKWLPGLLLAVILLLIVRWRNHFLVMPLWLLASAGAFYLVLVLCDIPLETARHQGWLVGPFEKVGIGSPLSVSAIDLIDWRLIASQADKIGTILVISCISLLLNASGLELVVREEIDLNRELRSVGAANFLAAFGGGTVGIHSLALSALGFTMGAKSRIVGLFSAMVCGSVLLFGSALLSYFPRPVMGAVLLFLGLSFLREWLYESWFKLPRIDCVLILFILAVIGIFGFLHGVAVGVLIAVVIFVVRYSHVNVIKHVFSGLNYHSRVDRSPVERRILGQKGGSLYILKLQGFIFFGTANNLLEEIRKRANEEAQAQLRYILLDFRFVNGVDSSAAASFTKMRQYSASHGYVLIFSNLSLVVIEQFKKRGFDMGEDEQFCLFPDLDRGVEWCENQMLLEEGLSGERQGASLREELRDFLSSSADADEFMKYLERREVPAGYYLMRQGDPPHSLYFLESGRLTVKLEGEGSETVRLRTMGAGSVVGELGLYLRMPSSASVVTEERSVFYRLSAEALNRLERDDPGIASAFHRFIVHRLGERLVQTNESLRALMD